MYVQICSIGDTLKAARARDGKGSFPCGQSTDSYSGPVDLSGSTLRSPLVLPCTVGMKSGKDVC